MDENQALHDRDTARIHSLSDQLHTTQNMLYDSTKDYLDLKYEFRACERVWMTEKDKIYSELDQYKEKVGVGEGLDPLLGPMHRDASPRFVISVQILFTLFFI